MGSAELVDVEASEIALAKVSTFVLANDLTLTGFFPLADLPAFGGIFTLVNFSALVAFGHLLAIWSVFPQ